MATPTIRKLDDALKTRLRRRAAERQHPMAEETRQILRAALEQPAQADGDLAARIRARFAALGDVRLVEIPRDPLRLPPAGGA